MFISIIITIIIIILNKFKIIILLLKSRSYKGFESQFIEIGYVLANL